MKKKLVIQGRIVVYVPLTQLRIARSKLVARGTTMAAWVRKHLEKLTLED